MAASPPDGDFVYPDPSLFGINMPPPPHSHPYPSTLSSGPNPHAAPAPAPAPIAGPSPAPRLSARGLQPFPALFSGLQAPIELTNVADIAFWDKQLLCNNPRC